MYHLFIIYVMHPNPRVKNAEPRQETKVNSGYGIHLDRSTIGVHLVEVFLAPTSAILLLLALFIMYIGFKNRKYAKLKDECCLQDTAQVINFETFLVLLAYYYIM